MCRLAPASVMYDGDLIRNTLCGLDGNLATVLCICDTVQQVIVTNLLGEKMIFVRRRACLISGAYVQQPAAAVCQRLFLICEEFGPNIGYCILQ
jgi:hypothetical protein